MTNYPANIKWSEALYSHSTDCNGKVTTFPYSLLEYLSKIAIPYDIPYMVK